MKNLWYAFILTLSLAMRVFLTPVTAFDASLQSEDSLRAFATQYDTWTISYQQGLRNTSFYQCDASDDFIFFSYSKHCCVDVYSIDGTFQYTYILPDYQNGSVNVRCENNYTYIGAKDNTVYVFDGLREVDHLSRDEAIENGYDFSWFREKTHRVVVDSEWICVYNEGGIEEYRVLTPHVIKQTLPLSGLSIIYKPIIAAIFVLFSLFLQYYRKDQK